MLANQWLDDKDKWYWLTSTGLMATNAYVKDDKGRGYCYVGSDGVWDNKYVTALPRNAEVVN